MEIEICVLMYISIQLLSVDVYAEDWIKIWGTYYLCTDSPLLFSSFSFLEKLIFLKTVYFPLALLFDLLW